MQWYKLIGINGSSRSKKIAFSKEYAIIVIATAALTSVFIYYYGGVDVKQRDAALYGLAFPNLFRQLVSGMRANADTFMGAGRIGGTNAFSEYYK
ncbi:hypothetical protein AZA_87826 [Nitrospirillum viridazoti Y2]|nr:hypothetical protein AZA_87826 [Nitrospirillum amazonense Y2]